MSTTKSGARHFARRISRTLERRQTAETWCLAALSRIQPTARMILFRGDSPSPAEEFARNDPYVVNGVVKRWYVREWTTVVGKEAETKV
jgi:hypothetical protein